MLLQAILQLWSHCHRRENLNTLPVNSMKRLAKVNMLYWFRWKHRIPIETRFKKHQCIAHFFFKAYVRVEVLKKKNSFNMIPRKCYTSSFVFVLVIDPLKHNNWWFDHWKQKAGKILFVYNYINRQGVHELKSIYIS